MYERELKKSEEMKNISKISQNIMNKIKEPDTIPKTVYEFRKHMQLLKFKPESFGKYLLIIPSETYTKLFKNSLDSDILLAILKGMTFIVNDNIDWCIDTLSNLSKCPSFKTSMMMLEKQGHECIY